jgi:hypothetical protein
LTCNGRPACVSGLSAYQISRANFSGSIISSLERQMKTFILLSHDRHVDVLRSTKILPRWLNACYSTSFNGPKVSVCDIAYTSEVRFAAILLLMTAIN